MGQRILTSVLTRKNLQINIFNEELKICDLSGIAEFMLGI